MILGICSPSLRKPIIWSQICRVHPEQAVLLAVLALEQRVLDLEAPGELLAVLDLARDLGEDLDRLVGMVDDVLHAALHRLEVAPHQLGIFLSVSDEAKITSV